MTKINQTAFDPEVPQGGAIRETIGWEASVPDHGTATHTFYLFSIYGSETGTETTEEEKVTNIINTKVAGAYITVDTYSMSRTDDVDTYIPTDAPTGTYSCATIIAEDYVDTDGDGVPDSITGIYDYYVDTDILTVVKGLGATIVSTSFSKV